MTTRTEIESDPTPDPEPTPEPMFARDAESQLRWLVDRALISDLMVEFARALDERDWDAYADTYTQDGVLAIGDVVELVGRDRIRTMTAGKRGLGGYSGTWHLGSNHAITIEGDTARLRSYLLGVHMLSEETTDHADGAGWYDCELARTSAGWRFTRVRVHEVWHGGRPLRHVSPPAGGPGHQSR
jgi:ketosteroid isomerase-like protein